MLSLSHLVSNIPPSPTLAASERANQLKAKGREVVSFTVGEPDLDTPEHIKEGAIEALKKGYTKYTAVRGILPLREIIAEKLKREQKVNYSPAEIIVTNGGKQALATACATLLNPGDEAIIPAPYWTSYIDMVKLVGGVPVVVQTKAEDGYLMSAEQLSKACSPRTKLIFINTPSNPTGACYSAELLKELGKVILTKPQVVVLADDVYEYLTYDGFVHESFVTAVPELRERTVLVNAFSKSYSMTGWRVGYAAGPRSIIDAMEAVQSQVTSGVCSIAQHAATKAYQDQGEFPRMMQREFAERLEIVCQAVKNMPGIRLTRKPRGAFFAFLEIEELVGLKTDGVVINNGADFSRYLLEKFDVVVVQGEAFGDPQAVRMSFALSKAQLVKGLDRIGEAAKKLVR